MKRYITERKFVLIYAVIVMLITLIPYLVGYWSAGEERVFSGFLFGVEDGNSYIAKMALGSYGKWLFETPYTAQEQQGVIAFLPYILLGKLAQPPALHEQLVALFHGFRMIAGCLMILAVHDFLSLFINSEIIRWLALISAVLGGGLGWVVLLFGRASLAGYYPLGFISPETFGFLSLLGLPHLALARAFFLWGFVCFIQEKRGYITGLLWLGLGLLQPIYVVLAWTVLTAFITLRILIQWKYPGAQIHNRRGELKDLKQAGVVYLISAPFIVYTAVSFLTDPVLKQWSAQNLITSPPAVHYLLAYGAAVPFVFMFFMKLQKPIDPKLLFLIGWCVCFPFLIYAPVTTQRRLAEGFWIVLSGLVFASLEASEKKKLGYGYLFLGLTIPTTLILIGGVFRTALSAGQPVYLKKDQVLAYRYFQDVEYQDQIVLGAYQTGNSLPAFVPVRVLVGHGPESYQGKEYLSSISQFFNSETEMNYRLGYLADNKIDYIFWGPEERLIGEWDPNLSDYLVQVYSWNNYQIFRFVEPSG